MKVKAARDLKVGDNIVLLVHVRTETGKMRTIKPNEVQDNDTVLGVAKTLPVRELVRGECGKGYHVNERRIRGKMERFTSPASGKEHVVPSPENGRIITSDGCYDYASRLVIVRG